MNLNTGQAFVFFHEGMSADKRELWDAIKAAGFTPVRVKIKDEVYEGPKS